MEIVTSRSAFDAPLDYQLAVEDIVTPDDITAIICLRLHEGNPWAADRLKSMASYYHPRPRFLVVDYGSREEYASIVRSICEKCGYDYHFEPDEGTYSPAAAHNRGFENAKTDLIFFCDVDCFGVRSLFGDIVRIATSLRMKSTIDAPLIIPVYHVGQADTERYNKCSTDQERSAYLDSFGHYASYVPFNKQDNFFIAPYSNVYLINKKMFSMSGGYDERFRGHGSEDFEFLTRLGLHINHVPGSKNLTLDRYGPLSVEFYEPKPYIGFRRFFEALSFPADNFGLKVYHLWHPRPATDDWQRQNDWKRVRMQESFAEYVFQPHHLLDVDFLRREKVVYCLCKHTDQWPYYLPLRLAGYRTILIASENVEDLARVSDGLAANEKAAVAIFNPYMKSHAAFKPLVLLAQDLDRQVIVIERGALPNTIYYDDDVAYNSPNFSEDSFKQETFTEAELKKAQEYVEDLRKGSSTLEAMESYEETSAKYPWLNHLGRTICFIPLQLEEDMAVTMFLKGEQTYSDFVASLNDLISAHPDILFIVKPHPLSKVDVLQPHANLVIASRRDNVHFLIDASSLVICYNSGVGLLSIFHKKPTFTLGNAFYRLEGAAEHASSAAEALSAYLDGRFCTPSDRTVARIAAWFLFRKYSTFIADDIIREHGHRKSHAYKNVLVTFFAWKDVRVKLGRQRQKSPFHWKSYLTARLGMRYRDRVVVPRKPRPSPAVVMQNETTLIRKSVAYKVFTIMSAPFLNKKLRKKMQEKPAEFFRDAKSPVSRIVGKRLLRGGAS